MIVRCCVCENEITEDQPYLLFDGEVRHGKCWGGKKSQGSGEQPSNQTAAPVRSKEAEHGQ